MHANWNASYMGTYTRMYACRPARFLHLPASSILTLNQTYTTRIARVIEERARNNNRHRSVQRIHRILYDTEFTQYYI